MSELGPDSKALLDMARGGDEPTAVDRARVRGALGARLAVGAIAAGAALTAASSSSAAGTAGATAGVGAAAGAAAGGIGGAVPLGIGMKILLVLGTATAVSVGAVSYVESGPAPSPSPSVTATATARAVPRAPSAVPPAPPQPAVSVAPAPSSPPSASAAPSALAAASPPMSPSVPPSSPTPAASAIDREIGLVREALAAIQTGDGGRALVLLDEHARRYPSGALSEEREAARVFALCSLGRAGEARVAAERFLRVFPHSPQAGRVRTSCGGENP